MLIHFWLFETWPVTLKIQGFVFCGSTVAANTKETKLRRSNQEASPSAGKSTRVVSLPCHGWKCAQQLFIVMWIFLRFLAFMYLLSGSLKHYYKDWCLMNSQPNFLILTSFQEDINNINLNHITIWNLALPIFEVFARISLNVNLSVY